MKECIVIVNNIEQFKKASLIFHTYAREMHPNFLVTEERAIRLFLNKNSLLGLIHLDIFDAYKRISYETLINEY